MGAARGLAVNRHDVGFGLAQPIDPGRESGGKQIAIQRVHHVVQGVMRGNAAFERQHSTQELPLFQPPNPGFHKILGSRKRLAQDQKHDLGQRIQHLAKQARVVEGRKMAQKRGVAHRDT